jgi:hypothetical protein
MASSLKKFTWYKSTVPYDLKFRYVFFFDNSKVGSDSDIKYNSVTITVDPKGKFGYLGFSVNMTLNPDLWMETQLPKDVPFSFLKRIFIELFSKRLGKILWGK